MMLTEEHKLHISQGVKRHLPSTAYKKGYVPWIKGKTHSKEVRKKLSISHIGQHNSLETEFKKGMIPWCKGKKLKPLSQERKKLQSKNSIKMWATKDMTERNKKISEALKGEKNYHWKGGISKDKVAYTKQWRHTKGISKKYISENCISSTKEYRHIHRQKRRMGMRQGGDLKIQTVQTVYEDNIKKYGTLTCYLCLKPIPFKKDELEHKIPISRGGTNLYENLGISCQLCNRKKRNKTVEEFLPCA